MISAKRKELIGMLLMQYLGFCNIDHESIFVLVCMCGYRLHERNVHVVPIYLKHACVLTSMPIYMDTPQRNMIICLEKMAESTFFALNGQKN